MENHQGTVEPPGGTSAVPSAEERYDSARITNADISRARSQIGIPTPSRNPPYNPVPDASSISHFAFGCGDDNPLWHDPRYAARTRWAGVIAPPLYVITAGRNVTPPFATEELRQRFRGLFRGVGKYFSGSEWEWHLPIRPGTPLFHSGLTTVAVDVRPSSFSGGRSVRERLRTVYATSDGLPVATCHETLISAERGGSRQTGKHAAITRQTYTAEDIARIDADYAAERRRGAEPRFWEDVEVGDDLGHVTKGPMTVVDIIAMHMAMGFGVYGFGPLRYAWKTRRRMPAFYVPDEYGVPDVVQRLHWDPVRAAAVGLPAPYDYGQMRIAWLIHLITNWMGDSAWLHRLKTKVSDFNYLGDTHWCRGTVVDKRRESGQHLVEVKVEATNQRGTVTTSGAATILLPSREHGLPLLPQAPDEIRALAAEIGAAAARIDDHTDCRPHTAVSQ